MSGPQSLRCPSSHSRTAPDPDNRYQSSLATPFLPPNSLPSSSPCSLARHASAICTHRQSQSGVFIHFLYKTTHGMAAEAMTPFSKPACHGRAHNLPERGKQIWVWAHANRRSGGRGGRLCGAKALVKSTISCSNALEATRESIGTRPRLPSAGKPLTYASRPRLPFSQFSFSRRVVTAWHEEKTM